MDTFRGHARYAARRRSVKEIGGITPRDAQVILRSLRDRRFPGGAPGGRLRQETAPGNRWADSRGPIGEVGSDQLASMAWLMAPRIPAPVKRSVS